MARSISEIKAAMAAEFMASDAAARRYGFVAGSAFGSVFGPVSVESVLLWAMAVGAWAVECLLDVHLTEVRELVESKSPHRVRWYRDRALEFIDGWPLEGDTGEYDLSGLEEADVEARRVVRHAVVTESGGSGQLMVKVAGEDTSGCRCRLDDDVVVRLRAYFAEIKDAGVRLTVVSRDGDVFGCEVNVAYDALVDGADVEARCRAAITDYVENLPFNGEYSNMALVDAVQAVEGVKIVDLIGSDAGGEAIRSRCVPGAGYFSIGRVVVNMEPYVSYDE